MNPIRLPALALAAVVPFALGPCATAQEPHVILEHGVPADAHVFIQATTSASPAPSAVRLERAIAHLVESRVHEDLLDLATMDMSSRRAAEARAMFAKVLGIVSRADWGTLFRQEVVFAEKLALPMPEYVMVVRVPADQGEAQLAGIRSMLEGLAELAQDAGATVRDVDNRAGKLVELGFGEVPVQFAAGLVGDAIVMSTSTRTTIASMRGLAGDGSRSVVGSARFRESSALVPAATEATSFVDMAGLLGFVSQAVDLAAAGAGDDDETVAIIGMVRALLEDLDIVDHMVSTSVSDGTTVRNTAAIRMRDGYESNPIVELCAHQKPWTDWYRFVPADATSFAFDSGMDIGGLIDFISSLAAEAVGGDAPWTDNPIYQEVRQKAGYLSGELGLVTFPADHQRASDTVMLLRLESTDGVASWLGQHLRGLARLLQSKGQSMTVETNGELHTVRIAAFPWIQPVIGVRSDLLVIATSPDAVARVEAVHQGQAPDIRSDERFAKLGIGGAGVGSYIEYGQLENGAGDLANLMSAAGFFMSLIPEDRDSRPAIKVGAILTKLAPALRELDMAFDYGVEMVPSSRPDTVLMRSVYRDRAVR